MKGNKFTKIHIHHLTECRYCQRPASRGHTYQMAFDRLGILWGWREIQKPVFWDCASQNWFCWYRVCQRNCQTRLWLDKNKTVFTTLQKIFEKSYCFACVVLLWVLLLQHVNAITNETHQEHHRQTDLYISGLICADCNRFCSRFYC